MRLNNWIRLLQKCLLLAFCIVVFSVTQANIIADVIVIDGKFFMVDAEGRVLSTQDGEAWQVSVIKEGVGMHGLAWNGSVLIAVDKRGNIHRSDDQLSWTTVAENMSDDLWRLASDGKEFIAIGRHQMVYSQESGRYWFPVDFNFSENMLWDVAWYGDRYFLLTGQGVYESKDGQRWQFIDGSPAGTMGIARGNDQYVLVGAKGLIRKGNDIANLKEVESRISEDLDDIVWTGKRFVAIGPSGIIICSDNGELWEKVESTTNANLYAVASNSKHIMAVGSWPYIDGRGPGSRSSLGNTALISENGFKWQNMGAHMPPVSWVKERMTPKYSTTTNQGTSTTSK